MSDDYKKRARKTAESVGKKKGFKLEVGENNLRLGPVPPDKKGKDAVYIEYMVHKNVGPEKRWFRCGHSAVNPEEGDCITCDKEIPKLEKKGKDERAAALAPVKMVGVMASKVSSDGSKYGPFEFWAISAATLQRMVLNILGSTKRDYVDPKKGYNFSITRTGTGQTDTRYTGPEVDEHSSKVPSKLIAALVPWSKNKAIPVYDEEAMKKALLGVKDEEPEEDSEDSEVEVDSSASGSSEDSSSSASEDSEEEKSSKKKKSKKEEESEDSDDSGSEDSADSDDSASEESEDSEEEKPAKSKSKKSSKSKDKKKSKKSKSSEDSEDEDIPF